MRRNAHNEDALTDDIYYVSAAAVADKILDRIQRGQDPLLIRSSMLALVPAGVIGSMHVQSKPD